MFKVVPMVNPDGVFHGHFRTDTRGCNLNRQYANPIPSKHPTIFAIKGVLKQLAATFPSLPGEPTPGGSSSSAKSGGQGGLWCYLDLHGYSARHGCYFIANPQTPHREWRSLFLASALQTYAPQFNADACGYGKTKKGTPSKRLVYATPFGQLHDRSISSGTGSGAAQGRAMATGGGARVAADKAASGAGGSSRADCDGDNDDDDDDDEDGAAGSGGDDDDDENAGNAAKSDRPLSLEDLLDAGENYASGAAGLVDTTELEKPMLVPYTTAGLPYGRLAPGERSRVSREWAQIKGRSSGKGEGHKDGTGRVCALRELKVQLSYTIECSCNLLSHTRVYNRLHAAAHLRNEGLDPYAAHHVQSPLPGAASADIHQEPHPAHKTIDCTRARLVPRSQLSLETLRRYDLALGDYRERQAQQAMQGSGGCEADDAKTSTAVSLQPPDPPTLPRSESYTGKRPYTC